MEDWDGSRKRLEGAWVSFVGDGLAGWLYECRIFIQLALTQTSSKFQTTKIPVKPPSQVQSQFLNQSSPIQTPKVQTQFPNKPNFHCLSIPNQIMYQPFPGAEILPVPADVQAMYDWAASQGIKWPKIVYPVRFPPGYIGSMATDTIEPGEAIVTAPNNSLVTTRVAYESGLREIFESNKDFFGSFEDMNDDVVLASYILSEKAKGPASHIAAFIAYQPKDPSNLQDWGKADLLELQDADLMHDTEKSWELHQEQWAKWREVFLRHLDRIPEELLTLEEFTWAVRLIGTRTFGKFAAFTTFFPVGELLNHDNVQSYYVYLNQGEVADSTRRYGGIVDEVRAEGLRGRCALL